MTLATDVSQVPDPLPSGYLFANYVIYRDLVPLRMGRAYLAFDTQLKAEVVINVLAPELRTDEGIARFRWGTRCAVRERKETVYSYGEWLGVPFVVVPYAVGVGATVDVGMTFPSLEE